MGSTIDTLGIAPVLCGAALTCMQGQLKGWDEMGWDGMGWDGTGWHGMG
jgi:hypothetical protein